MGLLRGVSALALVLGLVAVPASAQSVADFYRGKTIQLIIPSSMGGSVGLYGKLSPITSGVTSRAIRPSS